MARDPTAVWLLGSSFEPRGSSLYTLGLARRLPDVGFAPLILCKSAARIPARWAKTLEIREVPNLFRPLLRPWALAQLAREFTENPPALIHAQRRPLDYLAIELAQRFNCPYLVTVHDILPADEILKVHVEFLAGLIAVSPSIQRDLVEGAKVPNALVHMIANGVELPTMPTLPNVSSGRIAVVGTASALEPVKGLTYFLMAAELILSSGHDVEFLIAGSGPDEEVLRRAARILDVANRVTFVEHVGDYRQVLALMDVFVMPSLEQGLGTVMLEAMALGKPVVATRTGGIADFFVDGEHALLVPGANHKVLADKITYLLDNPEKARRLATTGQQFVRQNFSLERMTQQTSDLYHSILAESPVAGSLA